ncbi:rhamnogalacturonan acetylesterase [Mucilaginibacter sp. HMF5004]|uniref:rhamnogalacturonan acetylesterase n=1 Tax=Mucilaginibacter rivuli TaxID=2857527 RepID=UPI001C5D9A60|nr:rhamnogalacturonan acetylesterase [Mucilaginibacter rivuli]MBW4888299.1 rhamnogalacturonan acetylesterase [Mucilaginibacter rivuli]
MKILFSKISLYALCLLMPLVMSFGLQPGPVTIYLAGDSTMADKAVKTFPETGWGMPFKAFFDNTVTVKNIAKNGRSTKSFIAEGLWNSIADNLKTGDYVLIQFGHNDEVPTKATYTPEADYKANLVRFITETKAKGGVPVLITPVARRKFDKDGKVQGTHDVYAALVRTVAQEQNVPLIDLDKEAQALIQKFGPEDSKMLFNYLTPGENPNYPDGKSDDTHFSELGARKVAEMVLADIKALKLDLANRIVISHIGVK